MIRPEIKAKLISKEKTNSYIYELNIKIENDFSFKAGQYISLKVNENEFRAFSIANSPEDFTKNHILKIYVGPRPNGASESFLNHININDEVIIKGPYGIFTIDNVINKNPNSKLVFIGTGTGISPLLSMLNHISSLKYSGKIIVYFGLRYEKDIFLKEDFEKLNLDIEYKYCISKPENEHSSEFYSGHVTDLLVNNIDTDAHYFISGSTENVSSIANELRNHNCYNIYLENYG